MDHIQLLLAASGIVTAIAGLAALVGPDLLLRLAFRVNVVDRSIVFFVRHWGMLLFVMGALIVYGAYVPAARTAILAGAALEKIAIVLLIFRGPIKRTWAMTVIAAADGLFAALYAGALYTGVP